jgi:hypothetical protein
MKALGIAAATVVAFAPLSVAVATSPEVARAAPCAGVFANPASCENCLHLVEVYHTANVCEKPAPPRPTQAATTSAPVQIPEVPPEPPLPEPALREPPLPEPTPPSVIPVQSPTPPIVPPPSTIAVAADKEPAQPGEPWWPVALGYGGLAMAVGVVSWMISRRNGVRS